jgi:hypothetical protein
MDRQRSESNLNPRSHSESTLGSTESGKIRLDPIARNPNSCYCAVAKPPSALTIFEKLDFYLPVRPNLKTPGSNSAIRMILSNYAFTEA